MDREETKGSSLWNKILAGIYFPALILFLEVVFNLSTVKTMNGSSFLLTLLFSLTIGAVCFFLTSILPVPVLNRILRVLLTVCIILVFMVEFFVFRQFKIFYDLNTVTAGAGGVMSQFTGDILKMVLSVDGVVHILLFLLPLILLFVLGRLLFAGRIRTVAALLILVVSFFASMVSIFLIGRQPVYEAAYSSEYNFQNAVSSFGLLTGVRIELWNKLTGKKANSGFDITPKAAESTPAPASGAESAPAESLPEEPEKPKEYGYSQMDIDFDALAASADDEELAELDAYCASLTPSKQNEFTGKFAGKNLIFFSAEAFSGDIIDPELTPTLYRLSTKGIQFTDFIQPASAGTTGGEFENIMGLMPMDGGSSMKETAEYNNYMTMGNQLNRLGYYGFAYHNNSMTFYERDRTHNNLGYSEGYMAYGNGMEEYVKKQWPQSDLEMVDGTFPIYSAHTPFNVYYMTVSGHSGYSKTGNSMTNKNWDRVEDLDYSDEIKGYIAANLELEDALASLVKQLEEKHLADDTVIVLCADHFPYGLDDDGSLGELEYLSELYGYNVETRLERDHNTLILWCGELEKEEPVVIDDPVCSLDILPTLSNLFGVEWDSRLLPGRDVFSDAMPLSFTTGHDWKTDKGYYNGSTGEFTQYDEDEELPEDYVSSIKSIVKNKLNFCQGVLDTDYYRHVFGDPDEVVSRIPSSESTEPASSESAAESVAPESNAS